MELYRENFRNLPVPNHKAYGYQILHVALSSGPSPRGVNYNPRVELPRVTSFTLAYIVKSCEIFLLLKIRTMATNFSPCKGSYVLNQFPSNVMFAMNGFTYQPGERYRAIMALLFLFVSYRNFPICATILRSGFNRWHIWLVTLRLWVRFHVPYSPTILNNILCLFPQDFENLNVTQLLIG